MNSVPTHSSLLSLPLPLPLPTGPSARLSWTALPGCGEALGLASLRATHAGFWLIIVPSVARAESLEAELHFFLGTQTGPAVFPDTEVLPYDTFSPHQDLTSRRLMVLRDVAAGRINTLIVAASTLLPRLAPTRYIGGYSISLAAGQKLRPEQLRLQLETAGYQRVAQVMEHGDFAVRGSLLDFYPMGSEQPVRIDFMDDEIESLREFDPDSQLVTDVLVDFGCRFDNNSGEWCTLDAGENPNPVTPGQISGLTQFCTQGVIGTALHFPPGDTLLTARVRDLQGNIGSPGRIIVRVL